MFRIENFRQVTIPFDHPCGCRLKVRLCELRLHQEVSELHVYLGAICFPVLEWNRGLESKLWNLAASDPSIELRETLRIASL
jgi:hypothetical protein